MTDENIDRRKVLTALGATTGASLAGCSQILGQGGNQSTDGKNGQQNQASLGERVPQVVMEYWSDYGAFTTIQENMAPTIKKNAEDVLGVDYKIKPVQFSTQIGNIVNDQRTHHVSDFWYVNGMYRLDPQELTRWFCVDFAGNNGRINPANWANCDYTFPAINQQFAKSQDEREKLIDESQKIISEACVPIPLTPNVQIGAYREDEVEIRGVKKGSLTRINPNVFIKSKAKNRDQLVAGTGKIMVQTTNFPSLTSGQSVSVWSTLIHSPLLMYDSSYELQPYLAKNYEITNEGKRITFTLRSDATFHNGDQLTSEDVKFTFEQLVRGAKAGAYPKPSLPPYEEIKTPDDQTVEFNFSKPYTLFPTAIAPRWGILHKKSWVEAGAKENPGGVSLDPVIGSGPYKVVEFSRNSHIDTAPFEDHPVDVPSQGLYWSTFQDEQSTFLALKENQIQLQPAISPGLAERAEKAEGLKPIYRQGFLPFILYPQTPIAPTKFEAFRKALAACLNRQRMNQVAYRGKAEPTLYANHFLKNHPWRAPEEKLYKMAEPTGSPEKAKQILKDAGWGWDNNGNLRYPKDADLSPVWPKGEVPSPEEFPCLEKLGLSAK